MSKKNPSVLWNVDQTLEKGDKEKARTNIGVNFSNPSVGDTPTLEFLSAVNEDDNTGDLSFTKEKVTVDQSYGSGNSAGTSQNPISAQGVKTAIQTLDATNAVEAGKYITSVNETDGIVSINTAAMDTNLTENSQAPVTSGGVYAALNTHNHGELLRDGKMTNASYAVVTDANKNIKSADLTVTDNDATTGRTPTFTFVDSVTESSTGKITVHKENVKVSNGGNTLSWNTTTTVGTVGNTQLTVTMPADPTTGMLSFSDVYTSIDTSGGHISATGMNDTLHVIGDGGVNVSVDNSILKISSININNGTLSVDIGGTVYNSGFTANSTWDYDAQARPNHKWVFPAASYDTSTTPTTYTAGYMTGQDKESLYTHSHGNITYSGCLTDMGSVPMINDRIVITHGADCTVSKAISLSFNPNADLNDMRGAVSVKGMWQSYQPDMRLIETGLTASPTAEDNTLLSVYDRWTTYNLYSYFYDTTVDTTGSYIVRKNIPFICTYMQNLLVSGSESTELASARYYGVEFMEQSDSIDPNYVTGGFTVYQTETYGRNSGGYGTSDVTTSRTYRPMEWPGWTDFITTKSTYGYCVLSTTTVSSGDLSVYYRTDTSRKTYYNPGSITVASDITSLISNVAPYTNELTIVKTYASALESYVYIETLSNLSTFNRFTLRLLNATTSANWTVKFSCGTQSNHITVYFGSSNVRPSMSDYTKDITLVNNDSVIVEFVRINKTNDFYAQIIEHT